MFKIFINCALHIAPSLSSELHAIGYPNHSVEKHGVKLEGDFSDIIKLNLKLRTAHRVLLTIDGFIAKSAKELQKKIYKIAWDHYIPENEYISIESHTDSPEIRDARYLNLIIKDAICDCMRERTGYRPDSGKEKKGVCIFVHWMENFAFVYLDTSGESLAKHNYRKIPGKAPLQETLAASFILTANFSGGTHFVNPMCGSGTIAIEAALYLSNRYPGMLRPQYAFQHIKGYDENLYKKIRSQIRSESKQNIKGKIIATDIDPEAIAAAQKNALTAGVNDLITFDVCSFEQTEIPEGGGVIILNPYYGEREGDILELEKVYEYIGDFFKNNCKGYSGYIFTANRDLAKKVGLKTKRKYEYRNSTLDARLLEYELY